MTSQRHQPTRRGVIVSALAAGAFATAERAGAATSPPARTAAPPAPDDWDWLVGRWNVRHRKLKTRLAGSTQWAEFTGTCVNWPTLGGQGNVDDNVFDTPEGSYRGVGVRSFDPETGLWAIWWLDSRFPSRIDVPVRGRFVDGVGTFLSDDMFEGRPIKVRFRWSRIAAASAFWEQAFSPDGGATWETNWTMEFTRAAG